MTFHLNICLHVLHSVISFSILCSNQPIFPCQHFPLWFTSYKGIHKFLLFVFKILYNPLVPTSASYIISLIATLTHCGRFSEFQLYLRTSPFYWLLFSPSYMVMFENLHFMFLRSFRYVTPRGLLGPWQEQAL